MTNKKDTIIARYDVAFSISQESKRAQRHLYKDLTDEYRKISNNGYSLRDTNANTYTY